MHLFLIQKKKEKRCGVGHCFLYRKQKRNSEIILCEIILIAYDIFK